MNKKRVAVIGSGISGLTSAYLLNQSGYDVHLFEKNDRLGGHTHTTEIDLDGKKHAIDSGFIVFNDWTYPNFIRLMEELNVDSKKTSMSFSVFSRTTNFAYSGSGLKGLFSTKSNLFSIHFIRMLIDIIKFNRQAIKDFKANQIPYDLSLKAYIDKHHYGDWFINRYILPMGSAIWSASSKDIEAFPALFFIRFFYHHGLLNIINRPQWRVIKGGSSQYIQSMLGHIGTIYLKTSVKQIIREPNQNTILKVITEKENGQKSESEHIFDSVVFACHSNQALNILGDTATDDEKRILSNIPYRHNQVSMHTDDSFLPRSKHARSSWNVSLGEIENQPVLSYYMNKLQGLTDCKQTVAVSVNCKRKISSDHVLHHFDYAHPVFNSSGIQSQKQHHLISGKKNTYYCGAYWFNGFHEDGVNSAIRVCEQLGVSW